MIKDETFESLYRDELQDLYAAERQIIAALPGMIRDASTPDLKAAFEEHLEETKAQLRRLERIFSQLNQPPETTLSEAMRTLLAQGRMRINERRSSPVMDAALIAAARQVGHYEICGYESALMLAAMLNYKEAARLLQRTLDEQKEADSTLAEIAEDLIMGEELGEAEAEEEGVAVSVSG